MEFESPSDVVVAYDDTPEARAAVAFAVERAEKTGETVDILYVGRELTEEEIAEATDEYFSGSDVERGVHVVRIGGSEDDNVDLRTMLCETVRENGYGAVYAGNEEHGLIEGLTERSVTSALISAQIAPVIIVPDDS